MKIKILLSMALISLLHAETFEHNQTVQKVEIVNPTPKTVTKKSIYKDDLQVKKELKKILELKAIADGNQNDIKRQEIEFEKLELTGQSEIDELKVKVEESRGELAVNTPKGVNIKLKALKKNLYNALIMIKSNSRVVLPIKATTSIGRKKSVYIDTMAFNQAVEQLKKQKMYKTSIKGEIAKIEYLEKTKNIALINKHTKNIQNMIDTMMLELTTQGSGSSVGALPTTGAGASSATSTSKANNTILNTGKSILGFILVKRVTNSYVELSII